MERLVLVHGSVVNGRTTWSAQRPLADRFELVVLDRPGFPPNPPVARVDFESDAALVAGLLRAGDHLVGHSYGGVIALLAAAQRPDALGSLTVLEPPATRVARGNPDATHSPQAVRRCTRRERRAIRRRFSGAFSKPWARASILPVRSRPTSRKARRRSPSSAGRGRRRSRSTRWPRRRSRSSSCRERTTPPSRRSATSSSRSSRRSDVVFPGYGHVVQLHPEFNALLADFVERAQPA